VLDGFCRQTKGGELTVSDHAVLALNEVPDQS
jgi:hypothetical protein